jgi:hypothetical protein
VLIGVLKQERTLIVVDLEKLSQSPKLKKSSANVFYEIQVAKENIAGEYGLLSECNTYAFLVENKQLLRFFNVKNETRAHKDTTL